MQYCTEDILNAYEQIRERAAGLVQCLENRGASTRVMYTMVNDVELCNYPSLPGNPGNCVKIIYTYTVHGENSSAVVSIPLVDWDTKDIATLVSEALDRIKVQTEKERIKREKEAAEKQDHIDRAMYERLKKKFGGC